VFVQPGFFREGHGPCQEAAVAAQATTWVVWFVKSRCADGLEPRAVPLSFLAKGTTPRPRCRCPSFIKRNRILCRVWAGRMPQAKRDQCLKTFCAHNGTPMGLSVKRVHPSFMIDHHNLINNVKHNNISIYVYIIFIVIHIYLYIFGKVSVIADASGPPALAGAHWVKGWNRWIAREPSRAQQRSLQRFRIVTGVPPKKNGFTMETYGNSIFRWIPRFYEIPHVIMLDKCVYVNTCCLHSTYAHSCD